MDLSSGPPSYIFPILKSSEILQCFAEIGVPLTKQELTEPARHKEKLRGVFLALLDFCSGVSEEELQQAAAPQNIHELAAYPELHEERYEPTFFRHLQQLMKACGYKDFSWRDLYQPTPKRLRVQLSAVINLAKFREEQLKVYAELVEPRSDLIVALEEANKENEVLNQQLKDTESESQSKNTEMDEVMHECQELEMEIARKNKEQSAKREEVSAFKKKSNDLKDQLDSAQWALQEAEVEEERLRAQIVSSPGRRKMEISTLQDKVDAEKHQCEDLLQQDELLQRQRANAVQTASNLDAATQAIYILREQVEKLNDYKRKLDETVLTIQSKEQATCKILGSAEEAERYLARSEEKLAHQRKQHKLQLEAAQEALDSAKSQLLMVEKDRREAMARIEAGEAEVRELEGAIEMARTETDHEIDAMMSDFRATTEAWKARFDQQLKMVGIVQ